MFGQFSTPLEVKLALGSALVLLAIIGAFSWHASTLSSKRDALIASLATEEANHKVSRQSVITRSSEMARLVAEGEARKERIDNFIGAGSG